MPRPSTLWGYMQTLKVDLGERSYPIYIGEGLLDQPELLAPHIAGRQVAIVSNETVAPLYLERLRRTLGAYAVLPVVLPDGEAHKNWETLQRIFDALLGARHDRRTTVIALGGGVIGDMAGFAAACYQRGVDFIQVPTTLLSQVDSSVGGKTGINHPLGKNMVGAFYQPKAVIIDTDSLRTLPERELSVDATRSWARGWPSTTAPAAATPRRPCRRSRRAAARRRPSRPT